MEFQSSFFLVITLFLLVWLGKKTCYNKKIKVKSDHKLPPGPRKLPLIGNLHQLARIASLPHHALRDLSRTYGPMMHLQLGEISAVVVSSRDIAKEIMTTHDLAFANRPQLLCPRIMSYDSADLIFAPYGDYWRQMRKICTLELLSAKKVQSFSFIRQDEVANLVQSIRLTCAAGSPFNVTSAVFSLASAIVTRAAFGKKSGHEPELLSLLKKSEKLTGGFNLVDLFPSFKPIHFITRTKAKLESMQKELDKILDAIVNEHRQRMRSSSNSSWGEREEADLVDVLLRLQQSGTLQIPITDDNIKAIIADVFGAGSDTSAVILDWAMSELMKNPRVMEKAQAEVREAFKGRKTVQESELDKLSYLKSVIKETMRLHPPAPLLLPKECREACTIGGYKIPTKTQVMVNAWALGRDREYWHYPERFIPERFRGNNSTNIDFKGNNFEYIPFGAGRRMCPGILLGLANTELPLAALLYHFDWELPGGMKPKDLDMTESFGAVAARKNNLHLIHTLYNYE